MVENFEANARDYIENGLYDVMGKSITHYRNVLNNINRKEIELDVPLFKRQLMAMCIAGVEQPCVNKPNISKVFCNGYKLTINRKDRFIRYIAVEECEKDDTNEYNKKYYEAGRSEYILECLKIANKIVGLNSMGTRIINENDLGVRESYLEKKDFSKKYNNFYRFRDIRHYIEDHKEFNAMLIMELFDRLYQSKNYKPMKLNYDKNDRIDRLTYDLDEINKYLITHKINDSYEALRIANKIHVISVKRRKLLTRKRIENGKTVDGYTYNVKRLRYELGETISR